MNKFLIVLLIGLVLAGVLTVSLWWRPSDQASGWRSAMERELAQID